MPEAGDAPPDPPITGLKAITAQQWQSLLFILGGGPAILAGSAWWLSQDQDGPGRAFGIFGLLAGLAVTAMGILAARNLIRVVRLGQGAFAIAPDAFDRAVLSLVGAVFKDPKRKPKTPGIKSPD